VGTGGLARENGHGTPTVISACKERASNVLVQKKKKKPFDSYQAFSPTRDHTAGPGRLLRTGDLGRLRAALSDAKGRTTRNRGTRASKREKKGHENEGFGIMAVINADGGTGRSLERNLGGVQRAT